MAKIEAPQKDFTDIMVGVAFINGVGHTDDPWLIQRFKDWKFTVTEEEEIEQQQTETPQEVALVMPAPDDTNDAMKAYLDAKGIEYDAKATKADLWALIENI